MAEYVELSEKERILKEILDSARLLAEKRELSGGKLSQQIVEKGGFKNRINEEREICLKVA